MLHKTEKVYDLSNLFLPEDVLEALRLWHGREKAKWPLAQMRLRTEVRDEQVQYSSLADAGMAASKSGYFESRFGNFTHRSPLTQKNCCVSALKSRRDVLDVLPTSISLNPVSITGSARRLAQLTEILNKLENEASSDWQGAGVEPAATAFLYRTGGHLVKYASGFLTYC
jgi:hypothetical protein